eukprot:SAG11_NODE_12229_length_714_cov_1.508943_2_plen_48_part_01
MCNGIAKELFQSAYGNIEKIEHMFDRSAGDAEEAVYNLHVLCKEFKNE